MPFSSFGAIINKADINWLLILPFIISFSLFNFPPFISIGGKPFLFKYLISVPSSKRQSISGLIGLSCILLDPETTQLPSLVARKASENLSAVPASSQSISFCDLKSFNILVSILVSLALLKFSILNLLSHNSLIIKSLLLILLEASKLIEPEMVLLLAEILIIYEKF